MLIPVILSNGAEAFCYRLTARRFKARWRVPEALCARTFSLIIGRTARDTLLT